jgi:hypothetical protein
MLKELQVFYTNWKGMYICSLFVDILSLKNLKNS